MRMSACRLQTCGQPTQADPDIAPSGHCLLGTHSRQNTRDNKIPQMTFAPEGHLRAASLSPTVVEKGWPRRAPLLCIRR